MTESAWPLKRGRPPKAPEFTPSVNLPALQALRGRVADVLKAHLGDKQLCTDALTNLSAALTDELHYFASTSIAPSSRIHSRTGPKPEAGAQTLLAQVFRLLKQHGVEFPRSWHNGIAEVQDLELFCKSLLDAAGMKTRPFSARTVRNAFLMVDGNDPIGAAGLRP